MTEVGPLLARGRDADIFAYGTGEELVLRRARSGRSMETEAKTMEYVRGHGYPVPAVDHLSGDGTEMVMERVVGRSMVEATGRQPWTVRSQGAVLGDLHRRLHEIEAPAWLEGGPGEPGTALIHLDLHPLNVLVGPKGPMVIDWPNARRGQAATDVALSWVLMAAGEIPGNRLKAAVFGRFRAALVQGFLDGFDRAPVRAALAAVVDWKGQDPHMSAEEQKRMRAVVTKFGAGVA
jgi:aminoglycoside phosphotransferase (APT) family kinase protein